MPGLLERATNLNDGLPVAETRCKLAFNTVKHWTTSIYERLPDCLKSHVLLVIGYHPNVCLKVRITNKP